MKNYILNIFTTVGVVCTIFALFIVVIEFYRWLVNRIYQASKTFQMFTEFCVYYDDFKKYRAELSTKQNKCHCSNCETEVIENENIENKEKL